MQTIGRGVVVREMGASLGRPGLRRLPRPNHFCRRSSAAPDAADLPFLPPKETVRNKTTSGPAGRRFHFGPSNRGSRGVGTATESSSLAVGVHRLISETAGEFGHVVEDGAVAGDARGR